MSTITSLPPATPSFGGLIDHSVSIYPDVRTPGATIYDATPSILIFDTKAGFTYTMYDNGALVGTTVATAHELVWTVPDMLYNGAHTLTIYATDLSGLTSVASMNVIVNVAAGPNTPAYLGMIDHSVSNFAEFQPGNGQVCHDAQPSIVLNAKVGDTLSVYDNNILIETVKVTLIPTLLTLPVLANGAHKLSILESNASGVSESLSLPEFTVNVALAPATPSLLGMIDHTVDNNWNFNAGELSNDPHPTIVLTAKIGDTLTVFDNGVQIGTIVATAEQMAWTMPTLADGRHNLSITETNAGGTSGALTVKFTVFADGALVPADTTPDAPLPASDTNSHTVVGLHDAFVATADHQTADLSVDPAAYFKQATAHIEGGSDGVHTLHLSGSNEVLDLTSLSGKTAASKISGIEVIDLGGHGNALNLSVVDVLNLGQTDLFQYDGNKQLMVNGSADNTVDLLHATVARVADTDWENHGTANVGGVEYNVYQHEGAQTELLIQQGVHVVVH